MERFAKFVCGVGLLGVALLAAGCGGTADKPAGSGDSSEPVAGEQGVIAYSALTMKNPFFNTIAETMREEAESRGFEFRVNDAEEDVEKQAAHIDNYISSQVTAIVLNPADRKAIGAAIKKANAAGIPVFTNDAQCVADGVDIAGHAGTDNFQGGEVAGAAMIEVLGETGGEVAILHYAQAHSCVLQVAGFKKAIEAHNGQNPDTAIRIVAEQEGGGQQGVSYKEATNVLGKYPDLAAIFAINDPSALGAYQALEQAGRVGKVTIIGFDGARAGRQAIKEGRIYADPIQFPKKMAKVTIENIAKYLSGESYDEVQLFPTELYRQADAEQDPDLK